MVLADDPTPVPPLGLAGVFDPPDDDILLDTTLSFAYIYYRHIEGDEDDEGDLDLLGVQLVYRLDDRA